MWRGSHIRLPHIKIEYQEEDTYALGKLSGWLVAGFAVHWAWVYLFLFNGSDLFYPTAGHLQNMVFMVCIGVQGITLLCYGLFLKDARELFSTAKKRQRNRTVATACVFLGMLISIFSGITTAAQLPAALGAGVLTGFGSAVLLMSYGVSFSVCDLPTQAIVVAISFPLASVLFGALMLINPLLPSMPPVVCLALPFFEFCCLQLCSRDLVDNLEFISMTLPVRTAPFALHVCLPAIVFGLLLGLVSTRVVPALPTVAEIASSGDAMPIFWGSLFAGFAIVFAMLTQRKSSNFTFRTLMPLVAFLLAILAIADPNCETPYATFAFFASYTMVEISFWIFCADISQHYRISAFTVFGFGWGMLSGGIVAGAALSGAGGPLEFISTDITGVLAVAMVAVVFGESLIPNNAELRHTLKRGRSCPALERPDDRYSITFNDEMWAGQENSAGNGASAGTQAGSSAASALNAPNYAYAGAEGVGAATAEMAGQAPSHDAAREGFHAESEAAGSAANAAAAQQATDVGAAHAPAQPSAVGGANSAQPSVDAAGRPTVRRKGRFKRKCQSVADRYMLSQKETEVLFLLAKGRNSNAIQESLFISKGTANTHMRHIYRKLDVHSQAELVELVEQEEVEDEEF